MYIPKHFETVESAALYQLIDQYPLGAIILTSDCGIIANHIPFMLDTSNPEQLVRRGHVARGNTMRKLDEVQSECLVIFQGPQSYISPSFYPSKKEHGKVVPTFNYEVVHVRGDVQFYDEPERLIEIVEQLTNKHEAGRDKPWKVSYAPEEYIKKMLRAIVGIDIRVSHMEGKFKISQNQSETNQHGVVRGLRAMQTCDATLMADHIDALR